MTKLFNTPTARLASRAALAGLLAGFAVVKTSGHLNKSVISGAALAGAMAFAEAFTPLNGLVGLFKTTKG